jgi:hypothetical protein
MTSSGVPANLRATDLAVLDDLLHGDVLGEYETRLAECGSWGCVLTAVSATATLLLLLLLLLFCDLGLGRRH